MEMNTFEDVVKQWRDKGYTAYVRSVQNTWFIHWEDKKSVAFKIDNNICTYEIAGFKPTPQEVLEIKETAATIESVHLQHAMGNEYTHVENHVKKTA